MEWLGQGGLVGLVGLIGWVGWVGLVGWVVSGVGGLGWVGAGLVGSEVSCIWRGLVHDVVVGRTIVDRVNVARRYC